MLSPLHAALDRVDIGCEPLQRRQRIVAQRLRHHLAAVGEVELDHLEAECFLRREMIGERPLRHAGGLHDVAHTGAPEAALMHDAEALGQDLVAGGRLGHGSNMTVHIGLSSRVRGLNRAMPAAARARAPSSPPASATAGRGWLPVSAPRPRPRCSASPGCRLHGSRKKRPCSTSWSRTMTGGSPAASAAASAQAVVPASAGSTRTSSRSSGLSVGSGTIAAVEARQAGPGAPATARDGRARSARTAAWSRCAQASSAAIAPAMLSLPTFMPRPMPPVLQERRAHQVLAPGDDAGGGAAQELVGAVDDDVGAGGEEALQVVFGRRVDDHRHAARAADPAELGQRDLAEPHRVMRDDVDARRPCAGRSAPSR